MEAGDLGIEGLEIGAQGIGIVEVLGFDRAREVGLAITRGRGDRRKGEIGARGDRVRSFARVVDGRGGELDFLDGDGRFGDFGTIGRGDLDLGRSFGNAGNRGAANGGNRFVERNDGVGFVIRVRGQNFDRRARGFPNLDGRRGKDDAHAFDVNDFRSGVAARLFTRFRGRGRGVLDARACFRDGAADISSIGGARRREAA